MPKTTTSSKWAPPCKGLVLQNRFPILGFASGVLTKITQNPITMGFLQENNPYHLVPHYPNEKITMQSPSQQGRDSFLGWFEIFPDVIDEAHLNSRKVQGLVASTNPFRQRHPWHRIILAWWEHNELNGRHCVYGGWYMGVIKRGYGRYMGVIKCN